MKNNITFVIAIMLFLTGNLSAQVHYVKPVGTGNEDGTSWENASADLQLIIDNAEEGDSIFVAMGTYAPARTADDTSIKGENRKNAFVLRKNIKIFGGFSDTDSEFSARDWRKNETILSGKLNDDEGTYHVVVSAGNVGEALLDGFKITGGEASDTEGVMSISGQSLKNKDGAGISIVFSSPVLRNLIITGNHAVGDGGGLFIAWGAKPMGENLIVENNTGGYGGGGMIYNAEPIILNSLIAHNTSTGEGGGFRIWGDNIPTLINCTIVKNVASNQGGVFANNSINMDNTIIWGNTGETQLAYKLDFSSVNHSLVENQNPAGTRNLNGREVEPDFVDMEGNDFRLTKGSVCIDRGINTNYSLYGDVEKDVDMMGNPRLSGDELDLGAYEYQYSQVTGLVVVKVDEVAATLKEESTNTYEITIEYTDQVVVTVELEDENATVNQENIGTQEMETGLNTLEIEVTAEDGVTVTTYYLEITVEEPFTPVTDITLNKNELSMEIDDTEQLNATIEPADASNQNVIWISSDESIATVEAGLVTALKKGIATITAQSEDGEFEATCVVTVLDPVGISQSEVAKEGLNIYPNPAKEFVSISSIPENSVVRIIDMEGNTILMRENVSDTIKLNLQLNSGIYIIKVENNLKVLIHKLIVK